ncbi:hypothetical protein E2C01_028020 [Portunus trituberculatus]|uniref:Uncharacterized protein n=1 Tax=Portunus trituberculatus TaxID=210409 RepID=A0A5B7ENY4_PORTR|nr:hypothetical protein [Portunus trituberculatus]
MESSSWRADKTHSLADLNNVMHTLVILTLEETVHDKLPFTFCLDLRYPLHGIHCKRRDNVR